jgi:hypothetical protein
VENPQVQSLERTPLGLLDPRAGTRLVVGSVVLVALSFVCMAVEYRHVYIFVSLVCPVVVVKIVVLLLKTMFVTVGTLSSRVHATTTSTRLDGCGVVM